MHHRSSYIKISLRISYFLCYGIPILLCLWLLFKDRFGYSPANGLWCSIMLHKPGEPRADTYAAFFGYDLWIYLVFIVVPIYFIAVKLFIREKACSCLDQSLCTIIKIKTLLYIIVCSQSMHTKNYVTRRVLLIYRRSLTTMGVFRGIPLWYSLVWF